MRQISMLAILSILLIGATTQPALPVYTVGQQVEVKWGGLWRSASIVHRDSDIYQVNYNPNFPNLNEWVTVDRIRLHGSTWDIPYAQPTRAGEKPSQSERQAAIALFNSPSRMPIRENLVLPPPQVAGDWSQAKTVAPSLTANYQPDVQAPAAIAAKPIFLSPQMQFFERIDNIWFTSPKTGVLALAYVNDSPGKPLASKIDLLDLAAGKEMSTIALPPGSRPLAVSPEANLIASVSGDANHWGESTSVSIDDVQGKHVVTFSPFDAKEPRLRDVVWGGFLDEQHLLLVGRAKLAMFELPNLKVVYAMPLNDPSTPAMSPNREYLALDPDERGIAIINLRDGEIVSRIANTARLAQPVFSSDGQLLAEFTRNRLQIIDLTKNEIAVGVTMPPRFGITSAQWTAAGYLLLGGEYLFDVQKQAIIWDYAPATGQPLPGISLNDKIYAVIANGRADVLAGITLPDPAALKAAAAINPADAMAIHPGMKVSLIVKTGNEQNNQQLAQSLAGKLSANGIDIADDQPVTLTAEVIHGPPHDATYQIFGSPQPIHATISDVTAKISFIMNDQELWSANYPDMTSQSLNFNSGQSINQAVASAQASAWKVMLNVELPKQVAAINQAGLGRTVISSLIGK